jgi:hypothetical protein
VGHALLISCPGRAAAIAAALGCLLALAGCGGVEFQGRVFDAMGLSSSGGPEPDVKMAERPPLLIPPDTKALPAPGSGVATATAREDWPQNPEITREQAAQAKRDKLAKEEKANQPLHPYIGKPTLFDKWFIKKKDEGEEEEVPEPDPSVDKPKDESVAHARPQPLKPHVPQEITPSAEETFKPPTPESYKNPLNQY